jgi:hypothetical protein
MKACSVDGKEFRDPQTCQSGKRVLLLPILGMAAALVLLTTQSKKSDAVLEAHLLSDADLLGWSDSASPPPPVPAEIPEMILCR